MDMGIGRIVESYGRRTISGDINQNFDGGEFEFVLYPTSQKRFVRSHYCDSTKQALHEATGMMYAMFFEHKHPKLEIYQNGKLIHNMY